MDSVLGFVNTLGTLSDVLDMIDLLNSLELPPKAPSLPSPQAAMAAGAPVVTGDAATIAMSQGFSGAAKPGKHAPSGLTKISQLGKGAFPMYDDTRSWVDPNGYRLSDRVWRSGQDVRSNIDKAIRKATVTKQSFEGLARELEGYLNTELQPKRDKRGRLLPGQEPGTITRNGRGKGSYPARRLARTELTRQHSRMALYSADANPYSDGVRWRLSPRHTDADACNLHAKTYRKTDQAWPPQVMPPLHPFCVLPGTLVSGPPVVRSFTRWYVGEVVQLETAAGLQLTVTPNHPILTRHGWVAAGALKVGDEVVSGTMREPVPGIDVDDHHVPTLVEQVAVSLHVAGRVTTTAVPTTAEHFHGDGTNGDVCIVRTNRLLLDDVKPGLTQPGGQQFLSGAAGAASGLLPEGTIDQLAERLLPATQGVMGDGGAGSSSSRVAGLRQQDRFASGADADTSSNQVPGDGVTTDAVHPGQGLDGLPALVAFDQVTGVSRLPYSGHVYNLQTTDGYYISNGIVTHNCLCRLDQLYNRKPKVTNQLQQATTGTTNSLPWQPSMHPDDADIFTATSLTPGPLYSGHSAAVNADIAANGWDFDQLTSGFVLGEGAYFTPDQALAASYGTVMEFRVNVHNPIVINDFDGGPDFTLAQGMAKYLGGGPPPVGIGKLSNAQIDNLRNLYEANKYQLSKLQPMLSSATLKELGYDGVLRNSNGVFKEMVVFSPQQIVVVDSSIPRLLPAAPPPQTSASLAVDYNGLDSQGMVQLDLVQDALQRLEADRAKGLIEHGPYTGRRRQLRGQELAMQGKLTEQDFTNRLLQADKDLAAGSITAETHGFIAEEVNAGRLAAQHKQIQDQWQAVVDPWLAVNVTKLPGDVMDIIDARSVATNQLLQTTSAFYPPQWMDDLIHESAFAQQKVLQGTASWAQVSAGQKDLAAKLAAGTYTPTTPFYLVEKNSLDVQATLLQLQLPPKPGFLTFAPSNINTLADVKSMEYALHQAAKQGKLSQAALGDAKDFMEAQVAKGEALGTLGNWPADLQAAIDDVIAKAAAAQQAFQAGTVAVKPHAAGQLPVAAGAPQLDTPLDAIAKLETIKAQVTLQLQAGAITKNQKAQLVAKANSQIAVLQEINLIQHTPGALDALVQQLEDKLAKAIADEAAGTITKAQLKVISDHANWRLPVAKDYRDAANFVPQVTKGEFGTKLADGLTDKYDELLQNGINGATANRMEKSLRARLNAGIADPDERMRTVMEYAAYFNHKSRIDFAGGYTKKLREGFDTPDKLLKLYDDATPAGATVGWGTVQQVAPPWVMDPMFSPAFLQKEADRLTTWFNGQVAASSKASNAQRIGARMANDPATVQALEAYEKATGITKHSHYQNGSSLQQRMEGYYADRQSDWAANSGDNRVKPVRMQLAIDQEFGLNVSIKPYSDDTIQEALGIHPHRSNIGVQEELELMRRTARHMYEETQSMLAAGGFNELHMHRGVQLDSTAAWTPDWARTMAKGDTVIAEVPLQPASSFASKRSTSGGFAYMWQGDLNIMLRTVVKREQVLAFSAGGFGCFNEYEFVVLGADDALMEAYRMKDRHD